MKPSRKPRAGTETPLGRRWPRYRAILLRGLIVLGLAVATFLSLDLKARVDADPRFRLSRWELQIGEFPAWVVPEIREQIESGFGEGASGVNSGRTLADILDPAAGETIFRPDLLSEVRDRLLQNAWIREVRDARLSYPGIGPEGEARPGRLSVGLELRRPVAVVGHGGRFYLTDGEGVRVGAAIPGPEDGANDDEALEVMAERLGFPVIAGSESFTRDPAPPPGRIWPSYEVREGIEVARVLQVHRINETFETNRVLVIDIQNVGGRIEPSSSGIVVRTGGPRPMTLVWGRSPISREAAASPVEEVVQKLELVLAKPEKWYGDSLAVYLDVPGKLVRVTRS